MRAIPNEGNKEGIGVSRSSDSYESLTEKPEGKIRAEDLLQKGEDASVIRWLRRLALLIKDINSEAEIINLGIGQAGHSLSEDSLEKSKGAALDMNKYGAFTTAEKTANVVREKLKMTHGTTEAGESIFSEMFEKGAVCTNNDGLSGLLGDTYSYAKDIGIRNFVFFQPYFGLYTDLFLNQISKEQDLIIGQFARKAKGSSMQVLAKLEALKGIIEDRPEFISTYNEIINIVNNDIELERQFKINSYFVDFNKADFSFDENSCAGLEAILNGLDSADERSCITICAPNNPTGKSLSMQEWQNIISVLKNVTNMPLLVLDEPYDMITFKDVSSESEVKAEWRQHISITQALHQMQKEGKITSNEIEIILNNCIFLNSTAKAAASAAWRGGYAFSPNHELLSYKDGIGAKVKFHGPLSKAATATIEENLQSYLSDRRKLKDICKEYGEKVFTFKKLINLEAQKYNLYNRENNQPNVLNYNSDGGFYVFMDLSALLDLEIPKDEAGNLIREYQKLNSVSNGKFNNSKDIALYLLLSQHIVVIPDEAFFPGEDRANKANVRVSLSEVEKHKIEEVVSRFASSFNNIKNQEKIRNYAILAQVSEVKEYDIVIIGGGRFGVKSLNNLAEKLKYFGQYTKIALIHDDIYFGGPAYAKHLSPIPLQLHQAIYGIEAGDEFKEWLDSNIQRVFNFIRQEGGVAGEKWLEIHGKRYNNQNYGEGRIPRAVYGLYLNDLVHKVYNEAVNSNIKIDLLNARAINLERNCAGDGYVLSLKNNQVARLTPDTYHYADNEFTYPSYAVRDVSSRISQIKANNLIYSIGMMPRPELKNIAGKEGYYEDLYKPEQNIPMLMQDIKSRYLESRDKKVKIVIAGCGPSTMDVVSWLSYHEELQEMVELHIIASKPKIRPAAINSDSKIGAPYIPRILLQANITQADQFMEVINQEFDQENKGYSRAEIAKEVFKVMIKKVSELSTEEQFVFYDQAIIPLYLNFFAFDALETVQAWQNLEGKGLIKLYPAHVNFDKVVPADNDGLVSVTYQQINDDKISEQEEIITADIFLNCMGQYCQKIADNNNKDPEKNPAQYLLDKGLVTLNKTGRGFVNDGNYQMIDIDGNKNGLYIAGMVDCKAIGPDGNPILLAGQGVSLDGIADNVASKIADKALQKGFTSFSEHSYTSGITSKNNSELSFPIDSSVG